MKSELDYQRGLIILQGENEKEEDYLRWFAGHDFIAIQSQVDADDPYPERFLRLYPKKRGEDFR